MMVQVIQYLGISTHTPLAGRDAEIGEDGKCVVISTHTPLAGRDAPYISKTIMNTNFYSHAPRGA